jgi:hypothetical protein
MDFDPVGFDVSLFGFMEVVVVGDPVGSPAWLRKIVAAIRSAPAPKITHRFEYSRPGEIEGRSDSLLE